MRATTDPVEGLAARARAAVRSAQDKLRSGFNLTLVETMALKHALKAAVPAERAFALYCEIFGLGAEVRLRRQPVVPQLTAAEAAATALHVVHTGGEAVELHASPQVGNRSQAGVIRGRSRRVFAACLPDATAFSRSSTVRLADGTFAFDIQPGELDGLPVDLSFDPLVFDHDGAEVAMIEDGRERTRLHLPEALSLLGMDTVSFGHWMGEEFLKFLTARRFPEVARLPILIDAGIPRQNREALEAFTGPGHQIIEVPRHARVGVDRLWIVSNWFHVPKTLKHVKGIDPGFLAGPTAVLAAVYVAAWDELEARVPPERHDGRLFVVRDPARYRAILNQEEIEGIIRSYGFVPLRPEKLSWLDQFRAYRGATHVVMQAGSAEGGLLMCRPGTRICLISHGATPFRALVSQTLRDLGLEETVLVGEIDTVHKVYADRSNYRVDPALLDSLLSEMTRN